MLLAMVATVGCGRNTSNDSANAVPSAAPSTKLSVSKTPPAASIPTAAAAPMKRVSDRPANPDGRVFIAEYHHIRSGKGPMFRTVPEFKSDLERFYKDGFRPVTVAEYLSGKMPIPPGSSPVVFTFDDGNPTQFFFGKDGNIDPNCAVAIWQEFTKSHPDFPIKATFYILPNPWRQPALVQKKLDFLRTQGCEIGNHTITHPILRKLPDAAVEKEIGGAQLYIQKLGVPAPVSMAYPFGSAPKNKELLTKGFEYEGQQIHLDNALLVGAEPAPAPTNPKLNRYRIPRIQANAEPSGLDDWLNQFERGKVKVYVQP